MTSQPRTPISSTLIALLILSGAFFFAAPKSFAEGITAPSDKMTDQERDEKLKQLIEQRKEDAEFVEDHPLTEEEMKARNLVEVEPINILPSDLTNIYKIMPYRIRRPKWGHAFTLGYSQYTPINYQTDYFPDDSQGKFVDLYGGAELPLIEATYDYKYNFSLGSLAGEIGYGYYKNNSNTASVIGAATLTLQPVRLGARLTLDNLFYEPYLAPYISGGVYSMIFSESQGSVNYQGNTQLAPYYSVGILFQLNWLDTESAVTSYNESGLENSYLYLEVRQFMKSTATNDRDFSNSPALGGGISFEF